MMRHGRQQKNSCRWKHRKRTNHPAERRKYIGKRYVIPKLYVIEYITRQQQ